MLYMATIIYKYSKVQFMTGSSLTVRTLNNASLKQAADDINELIFKDFIPDIIIGIRSGGYVVAEIMAQSAPHKPLLLPISRRRASTEQKSKIKWLKTVLRFLPYAITDRLRMIEHKKLMKQPVNEAQEFTPDAAELSTLRGFLQARKNSKILIVDDAVDSGATMKAVLDLLDKEADPSCIIKTAAITVTTDNPIIKPDYALYNHVLFRFPWSFDFKG